jgi:hypothetical protein
MTEGIYVPMPRRAERDLQRLIELTGMDEPRVISLCITHMLATLHEFDNDNVPAPSRPKGWRSFVARLVGSTHNDDFPETTPSVSQPSSSGTEGRSALGASNSESRPEL